MRRLIGSWIDPTHRMRRGVAHRREVGVDGPARLDVVRDRKRVRREDDAAG